MRPVRSNEQMIKAKAIVTWFIDEDAFNDEGVSIEFYDEDGVLLASATGTVVRIVDVDEDGFESEVVEFDWVDKDIEDPAGLLNELAKLEGEHEVLVVEEEDEGGVYLVLVKILN